MPNRLGESLALFDSEGGDYAIYEKLAKLWDDESHTWTEIERREFQHIHPKAYLGEVPSNPGNHGLCRNCSALPTMTFYRLINTVYEGQDWSQRRWFAMLLDIHQDHPELQAFINAKFRSSSRTQVVRRDYARSVSAHATRRAGSTKEELAVVLSDGEGSGKRRNSDHAFSNSIFRPLSAQLRNDSSDTALPNNTGQQPRLDVALQLRHANEGLSQGKKRKHSTSDAHATEYITRPQAQEDEGDDEGDMVDTVVSLKSQATRTEAALDEVFINIHQVSDETEKLKEMVARLSTRVDMMEEKEAERSRKIRRSLSGNY